MAITNVTNKPANAESPPVPSMVFDREEGNINPGVGGLPAAIIQGIANDQAALRKAAGASPIKFRPASRRPG